MTNDNLDFDKYLTHRYLRNGIFQITDERLKVWLAMAVVIENLSFKRRMTFPHCWLLRSRCPGIIIVNPGS